MLLSRSRTICPAKTLKTCGVREREPTHHIEGTWGEIEVGDLYTGAFKLYNAKLIAQNNYTNSRPKAKLVSAMSMEMPADNTDEVTNV